MSENSFFDAQYISKKAVTAATLEQVGAITEPIKVESAKYGEAKPKRIILRAKIVHDQS